MFKLAVLFTFVVSSSMVLASPSALPVQRAPGCCRDHGEVGAAPAAAAAAALCDVRVAQAVAPLHAIMQLQALTIQGCMLSTMNATTAPQRQSSSDPTTPAPAPSRVPDDTIALHNFISDLMKTIHQLNTTDQELMSTIHNLTTTITGLTTSTTPASTECGHESGYKYYSETGSCYRYHEEEVEWTRANDACVMEGAQLAVVNGRGEARIFGDMVEKASWLYVAHLGYRRDSDGVWRAVTGETLDAAAAYSPWRSGWPDTNTHNIYAGVWADGTLGNLDNVKKRPFICEKRPH